jgi:hypothetical protein
MSATEMGPMDTSDIMRMVGNKVNPGENASCRLATDKDEPVTYDGGMNPMGQRQGKGSAKYKDGSTYEGYWEFGYREGEGCHKKSYEIYTGCFKNDIRHGKGTLTDIKSGTELEGNWVNGMLHGRARQWTKDGQTLLNSFNYHEGMRIKDGRQAKAMAMAIINRDLLFFILMIWGLFGGMLPLGIVLIVINVFREIKEQIIEASYKTFDEWQVIQKERLAKKPEVYVEHHTYRARKAAKNPRAEKWRALLPYSRYEEQTPQP